MDQLAKSVLLFPPSLDGSVGLVPVVPVPFCTMLAPSGPDMAVTSPERAKAKPPLVLTFATTLSFACTSRSFGEVFGTSSMATLGFAGVALELFGTSLGGVLSDGESLVGSSAAFCSNPRRCRPPWCWESPSSADLFESESASELRCESPRVFPLSVALCARLSSFSFLLSLWSRFSASSDFAPESRFFALDLPSSRWFESVSLRLLSSFLASSFLRS